MLCDGFHCFVCQFIVFVWLFGQVVYTLWALRLRVGVLDVLIISIIMDVSDGVLAGARPTPPPPTPQSPPDRH